MNGRALYIEIDEYCRAWLRNLVAADLICPGDVVGDILDVRPRDLDRYNQVHAFAGIGIWSGSLRDAGIRDTDYVWTGSCPCQPFSAAGQRGGFADERHLWPAFFHLIKECGPPVVFGEQVASPDGLQWFDLVSSDLEGTSYAIGAADLCAAGIAVAAGETEVGQPTLEWIRGAIQSCPDPFLAAELRDYAEWFDREAGVGPAHIRQRLCWMAYTEDQRHQRIGSTRRWRTGSTNYGDSCHGGCDGVDAEVITGGRENTSRTVLDTTSRLADADEGQRGWVADRQGCEPDRTQAGRQQGDGEFESGRAVGALAYSTSDGWREERQIAGRFIAGDRAQGQSAGPVPGGAVERLGISDSSGRSPRSEATTATRHGDSLVAASSIHDERSPDSVVGNSDDARSQGRSERRNGADQRTVGPTSLAGWTNPDWIICTDGKARPIESGTFPLAHGQSNRVGRLRAYGNAMHRAKITQFILAAQEAIGDVT